MRIDDLQLAGGASTGVALQFWSRRALALAVAIQLSRYCNSSLALLPNTAVSLRNLLVCLRVFQGVLVTETRPPCFCRSAAGEDRVGLDGPSATLGPIDGDNWGSPRWSRRA